MLRFGLLCITACLSLAAFAQTPQLINYQAVARDAGGDLQANTALVVRLTVHKSTAGGIKVYAEEHNVTTNDFGLFDLHIGGGTPTLGTFVGINWADAKHFLNVNVNGVDLGTTQLVSVPYAMHAGSAHSADSLSGSMAADSNDILQFDGTSWKTTPYLRVGFHASASTDQTVAKSGYDTLGCNNSSSGENFEYPPGVYDNATYAFIAPVDGVYFFEAAVLWENANLVNVRNSIFIRINHTDEVGEWSSSGGTDFFGTGVSSTVELVKGDEVRIRVYNGDSANSMDTFSQSGKYCYFSGFLVFAK